MNYRYKDIDEWHQHCVRTGAEVCDRTAWSAARQTDGTDTTELKPPSHATPNRRGDSAFAVLLGLAILTAAVLWGFAQVVKAL